MRLPELCRPAGCKGAPAQATLPTKFARRRRKGVTRGRDPDGAIGAFLHELHARYATLEDGEVASYIPELFKADPNHFGIAIATTDGKVYTAGDCDVVFTIQSVSKVFMYALALETLGREQLLKHVGVEPTGAAFNATVFDEENNRPSNPMVNAGAIGVTATMRGADYADKHARLLAQHERYAGRKLAIDEAVFHSERETGERNRAIAALMRQAAMLAGDTDEILDLYFSQCSVLVNCRDLALMAATLANAGVQPLTGEQALTRDLVPDVLTVMHSCGMYNYAGQWSYEVGIPAKSGVAGSIIGVLPGQMGLAVYSPPLDRVGNSVRGIAAFKDLAERFALQSFRTPPQSGDAVRRELTGDVVRSKRRRSARELALLAETGRKIRILEVQGALFFGSAERVLRRAETLSVECSHLIFDMRRVSIADRAAEQLFALSLERPREGVQWLFADIGHLPGLNALADECAENAVFADVDGALEWCEGKLIAAGAKPTRLGAHLALAQIEVFRGLSRADLKLLEGIARPFVYEPGQKILREGDPAHLFFVIATGGASVRLRLGDGASVRVASLGPGATLGEMALLDGKPRSADVVADERTVCYGFSVEEVRGLEAEAPQVYSTVLLNIAADLAERVRAANNEIRALKQ
jgi:glutaminase